MRRALTKALRRHRPRAIVFSSTQATMLQPRRRLRGATAVHFDEPAASNRSGPGTGLIHALERRALGRVRLLLPMGVEPSAEANALGLDKPTVALPVAIGVTWSTWESRARTAVVYGRDPEKKGLDLAVAAFAAAAPEGWRLQVTGIEAEAGRRHLARHGVPSPPASNGPASFLPPGMPSSSARRRCSCPHRATRTTGSLSSRRSAPASRS